VGPDLWTAVLDHPDLGDRALATHIAESPAEVRLLDEGDGPLAVLFKSLGRVPGQWPGRAQGPVARMAAGDVLRPGLVAAHCVQVNDMDAMTLAALDVRVAHCPTSNTNLQCGDAPVALLQQAGVIVGLGTDGPASAGPYDLRAEARAAGEAAARRGEPRTPAELLAMATTGSAEAIGMDHIIGSITPGLRADLVAIQPGDAEMAQFDVAAAVLDPRSRVTWVMVDGQVMIERGDHATVDVRKVIADAQQARADAGLH
jgi:5-methylthioadenosine/S-adenosylhomocysteine deaminase